MSSLYRAQVSTVILSISSHRWVDQRPATITTITHSYGHFHDGRFCHDVIFVQRKAFVGINLFIIVVLSCYKYWSFGYMAFIPLVFAWRSSTCAQFHPTFSVCLRNIFNHISNFLISSWHFAKVRNYYNPLLCCASNRVRRKVFKTVYLYLNKSKPQQKITTR